MDVKLMEYVAVSSSGMIFNARTGESYSVNRIGMIILDHIRRNADRTQLRKQIVSEYDIDDKSVDMHIDDFILFLKQFRLVEFFALP